MTPTARGSRIAVIAAIAGVVCWGANSLADMATVRIGSPAGAAAGRADKPTTSAPSGYVAFTRTPPALDGKGADAAWGNAHALRIEWTLDGSAPAGAATEIRLLRDERRLYVFARCAEPFTQKIKAAGRGRDQGLWEDDSVEMFLGTDDDFDYHHFIVNSVGATYDGFNKDSKWNSGIEAVAAVGKSEWTATWSIPLTDLAVGGKSPREWIANFTRNRQTRGRTEEAAWSPTFSGDSHLPRKFGRLIFDDPPREILEAQKPAALPPGVTILSTAAGEGAIRFDLSVLPKDARIIRADLFLSRTATVSEKDEEGRIDPEVYALTEAVGEGEAPKPEGKPLEIRAPWFDCFDATAAVQAWASGQPNGGFFVKAFPLWRSRASYLEVCYEGQPTDLPPQVTGLKVFHRSGQTFITWKEIEDLVGSDEIRWGQLRRILGGMDGQREVRYAVYRSDKPITAAALPAARRIATVKPLSCWNVNGRCIDKPIDEVMSGYWLNHGQWDPFVNAGVDGEFGLDCRMDRLVIESGAPERAAATRGTGLPRPLPRGTGLYVHTPADKGKAYYAVVAVVNGRQSTAQFSAANSTAEGMDEVPARPEPVWQGVLPPRPYWNYPESRHHYVQWVAPPMGNLPSQYYNWTVALPDEPGEGMPLELSLPRDGHSYYWTPTRLSRQSIVLVPYDFPINSLWRGYHESLGTLRSFRQGEVQPYTERRLLAFVEWARSRWPVDKSKVVVTTHARGPAAAAERLAREYPEVLSGAAARRGR